MAKEVTVVVSSSGAVDSVWFDPAQAARRCESLDESYTTVVADVEDSESEEE